MNDYKPKAAKREIRGPWRTLMAQKGIPSIRRLAEKADLDHMTTTEVVYGDRQASERVIQAIGGALDLDMPTAYRLMGHPAKYAEPWTPPAEAARLTPEQRRVIEDLIRVLVDGERIGSPEEARDVRTEPDPSAPASTGSRPPAMKEPHSHRAKK